MDSFDRSRNLPSQPSPSAATAPYSSFHTANSFPPEPQRIVIPHEQQQQQQQHPDDKSEHPPVVMKGPKRKRLAKACDACHKSKRRCDGTAPCSNCYYASKACTYTDSSGRPVPAPRAVKQDRDLPPSSTQPQQPPQQQQHQQPLSSGPSSTSDYRSPYGVSQVAYATDPSHYSHHPHRAYPPTLNSSGPTSGTAAAAADLSEDDRSGTRKRFRNDRGNPIASEDIFLDGPIIGLPSDRPIHIELDHSLTRELTNLFFTHCHPARAVIHKPTFTNDLSHNRVPKYLLYAVCALAAPLSKQPHIRTTPARFAGKPFAQEALSLMFDGAGRLVCEPNLATAQALAILLTHDVLTKERSTMWNTRYADLALQIIENLGVHEPDRPMLTPMPSPEFIHQSFKREAVRRIFWLIHLLDVMASIYFKKPTTFTASDLRLRLPVDETSFELGVHSTLPEYLYLGAVRTQYASEFGHLIRTITIYAKVEYALDGMNDPETGMAPQQTLIEAEKALDAWAHSLPDHLRFSEQSLQVQQSMFETSSNMGAWCWCCMHVYHASCALALNLARQRSQRSPLKVEPQWAPNALDLILNMLGERAMNSVLMGPILWSFIKYCNRKDDPQVRQWCVEYEEAWGTTIFEMAQDNRQQPSPITQHQYPSSAHPQQQQQQVQQMSSQASADQQNQLQQQQKPQVHHHPIQTAEHARGLDTRLHGGAGGGLHLPHVSAQPSGTQGGDGFYGKRSSPNQMSGSFQLGRPVEELRMQGSSMSPNNGLGPGRSSIHPLPGPGVAGAGVGHSENEGYGAYSDRDREVQGQGGGGNGVGSNGNGIGSVGGKLNGGQRDGLQQQQQQLSLPSLKASGLLDWNNVARDSKPQFGVGPRVPSPRRTPPTLQTYPGSGDSDTRASNPALSMPIGLPWLAEDSR